MVPYAEKFKKLVNIPIITTNRINDLWIAECILKMCKADFIGMGRASLAAPHLPARAKSSDLTSIRYCIGCQGCTGKIGIGNSVTVLVNPSVGRESELDYSKVKV